jgi:hypothetical protein
MKYYIYTLEYNKVVFYIGKSLNPEVRFRKHKSESKLKRTYKEKFINKILIKNEDISMSILDVVYIGTENYFEEYWISQFKQWGFKLCNSTSGGEGGDYWSGKKHSKETKQKLSERRYDQIADGKIFKQIGEKNGRSKLTDQIVIEMRKLKEDGYSYGKLALKFGVAKSTVINIIKRRKWNHI